MSVAFVWKSRENVKSLERQREKEGERRRGESDGKGEEVIRLFRIVNTATRSRGNKSFKGANEIVANLYRRNKFLKRPTITEWIFFWQDYFRRPKLAGKSVKFRLLSQLATRFRLK